MLVADTMERAQYLLSRLPMLREAVEKTLKTIKDNRKRGPSGYQGWCVNWADLYCSDVSVEISEGGICRLRVLIEEASPDSSQLCEEVRRLLEKQHNFANIGVYTEW